MGIAGLSIIRRLFGTEMSFAVFRLISLAYIVDYCHSVIENVRGVFHHRGRPPRLILPTHKWYMYRKYLVL